MRAIDTTFRSGANELAGTLLADDKVRPAALLISGSGPIDRDSNTKRLAIGVMGQIAQHLAGAGIASFRFDKRGVGASEGDYQTSGLFDNVVDAEAALETLRSHPGVDPDRVFLVGHSEGALIATELAAAHRDLAGVVLIAGTAVDGAQVLRWQVGQVAASLPRPVRWLTGLLRIDLAKIQAKRLAKLEASTTDTVRVQLVKINAKWFREFMAHDPSTSLSSVEIPVLALGGSKDIQVDPDDAERICQLVQGPCTHRVLDDLTHLLRTEPGPPSIRTYKKQAKRPVEVDLLDAISSWVAERAVAEVR